MRKFKSRKERSAHISRELRRVTKTLDGLAADTGYVAVTLDIDYINDLFRLGTLVLRGISETNAVVGRRLTKAGYVRDEQLGMWVPKEEPKGRGTRRRNGK